MDDLLELLACVIAGAALGIGPVLLWLWIWGAS